MKHEGKYCGVCNGQSWRVDGDKCLRCGLAYEPEPAITMDYIEAQPRENRSIMPAGGGLV